MPKNTAMTPREFCAKRRCVPFKGKQPDAGPGVPAWKKMTKGLICVTDGTAKDYVAPGLIFAVEVGRDGVPAIASYWDPNDPTEGLGSFRPRTLEACKFLARTGKMTVRRMPLSYKEMIRMARAVHQGIWVPKEDDFWAEYGL